MKGGYAVLDNYFKEAKLLLYIPVTLFIFFNLYNILYDKFNYLF